MSSSMRPTVRKAPGVLVREVGDEFVVVHPLTNEAHALRGPSADAWRNLDAGLTNDHTVALEELRTLGLVEPVGISRRGLLQRAGTVAVAGTVITIAMPEVIAAASTTTPPMTTTSQLNPDTFVGPGQAFTLTFAVTGDDGTIPTSGLVTVTDPYHVSGANGTAKSIDGAGQATFSFVAPTTPPSPNQEDFTATYAGTTGYSGSSDKAHITFTSTQINKTAPTISFSSPTKTRSAVWTLTVTLTGINSASPTGTLGLATTSAGATVSPASKSLTAGPNATSTATFTITNPSAKKPRSVVMKATYTPGSDPNYNTTSGSLSYTTTP